MAPAAGLAGRGCHRPRRSPPDHRRRGRLGPGGARAGRPVEWGAAGQRRRPAGCPPRGVHQCRGSVRRCVRSPTRCRTGPGAGACPGGVPAEHATAATARRARDRPGGRARRRCPGRALGQRGSVPARDRHGPATRGDRHLRGLPGAPDAHRRGRGAHRGVAPDGRRTALGARRQPGDRRPHRHPEPAARRGCGARGGSGGGDRQSRGRARVRHHHRRIPGRME